MSTSFFGEQGYSIRVEVTNATGKKTCRR